MFGTPIRHHVALFQSRLDVVAECLQLLEIHSMTCAVCSKPQKFLKSHSPGFILRKTDGEPSFRRHIWHIHRDAATGEASPAPVRGGRRAVDGEGPCPTRLGAMFGRNGKRDGKLSYSIEIPLDPPSFPTSRTSQTCAIMYCFMAIGAVCGLISVYLV